MIRFWNQHEKVFRKIRMTSHEFDQMTNRQFDRYHFIEFNFINSRMFQKISHRNEHFTAKHWFSIRWSISFSREHYMNRSWLFSTFDRIYQLSWWRSQFRQQFTEFDHQLRSDAQVFHARNLRAILQKWWKKKNETENEAYYIDRSYRKKRSKMRDRDRFFRSRNTNQHKSFKSSFSRQKKCFVCEKIDCWFINHTFQERNDSIKKFKNKYFHLRIRSNFNRDVQHWIIEYEDEDANETIQFFNSLIIDFETYNSESDWLENVEINDQFYISYEVLESFESSIVIEQFVNNSLLHWISKCDEIISSFSFTSYIYNVIFESRYESTEFKNIFIDTNAAIRSNAEFDQYETLKRFDDSIKIDHSTIESVDFIFEMNITSSIESINLHTSMKSVIFHIMIANTFFLLCLIDMNKMKTFFNNITNQLIQSKRILSVICRYGHVFLLWHINIFVFVIDFLMIIFCFFTEVELRQLHRRFGHFSVRRFQKILDRIDHDVDSHVLYELIRYCDQCQRHGRFSKRFVFIIKNDVDFNFNLIVNIFYFNDKSVFHVMNETIRFQTSRWLKNISVKHVWKQIRFCWIDTYLRSSDFISIDAEKQFIARKFKQYVINMKITIKIVSVETHHSID